MPRLLGWTKARQRERSDELLGLVGLDPAKYRDRFPSQLSGGERQRVGVARALAADPPIMLMDEPFGAVDPIVRDRLQNEFLRLQETIAKTILFVTHDIDEAIKMGDLVAVFQDRRDPRPVRAAARHPGLRQRPRSWPASSAQDRGLKRLSLLRVSDVELRPAVTTKVGDPVAEARRRAADAPGQYVLVVDEADRPLGWVALANLPADGTVTDSLPNPVSPMVSRRTTLKDALSMMLDADVQTGVVVDRDGRVQGLITIESVARKMREGEHAPAFDDAAALIAGDDEPREAEAPPEPGELDQAAIEQGA